jgi:hypothetical protein
VKLIEVIVPFAEHLRATRVERCDGHLYILKNSKPYFLRSPARLVQGHCILNISPTLLKPNPDRFLITKGDGHLADDCHLYLTLL